MNDETLHNDTPPENQPSPIEAAAEATPSSTPEPDEIAAFDPKKVAELDEVAERGFRTRSRQQRSLDAVKDLVKKAWTNDVPATRIAYILSDHEAQPAYTVIDASTISRYCKAEFGPRKGKKTRKGGSGNAAASTPPPGPSPAPETPLPQEAL